MYGVGMSALEEQRSCVSTPMINENMLSMQWFVPENYKTT